ncbi:MAG: hypothetical protein A2Z25_11490 [Planctomycetes bacterium RBG_16_55_9]|nr:MAG: hypothetical protein A2Z25_11490 [Planctomycetes bacterium RBG_16_55_9]
MLRARDIMTKPVVTVTTDTPLHVVMELLVEHDISGIPVVKDETTLVAIISEKDILKLFADLDNVRGKTVRDIMTQPAIFFEEHESIADVCECLANNDFRRIPVTSRGELVGIISRADIIRTMLLAEHAKRRSLDN